MNAVNVAIRLHHLHFRLRQGMIYRRLVLLSGRLLMKEAEGNLPENLPENRPENLLENLPENLLEKLKSHPGNIER
jgi:hypothetical protein